MASLRSSCRELRGVNHAPPPGSQFKSEIFPGFDLDQMRCDFPRGPASIVDREATPRTE